MSNQPRDALEIPPPGLQKSPAIAIRLVKRNEPAFNDVIRIRSLAYHLPISECADPFDDYSETHLGFVDNEPVGTLRITRAIAGALDCEPYFPSDLLSQYRSRISSANRFCLLPGISRNLGIARKLCEAAWVHGRDQGVRLDLIDVHTRGIAYYSRLGYVQLNVATFRHPLFGTPSVVMAFTTEPTRETLLRHLFQRINDPVTAQDIARWIAC